MPRPLAAARLYVLNKWMLIWTPLIVVGSMILLTMAIRVIMLASGADPDAVYFNGAFQAAFWTLMAVAVAASTQVFPYAFAMSLTRREFMAGTLIMTLCVGVGYGVLYAVVAWFEEVTDGYWFGARSFDLAGFVGKSIGTSFVFYTGLILLFFTLGLAFSMLWKRTGGKGLVTVGLALAVIFGVLVTVAGLNNAWPSIWAWMLRQTPMTVGGYTFAASVLLAGASYLLIRHAEP